MNRVPVSNWRCLAVLVSVLCVAGVAQAQVLAFKGIELGSHIARTTGDSRFECHAVATPIADRVCALRPGEKETIAGAPLDSLFLFYERSRLTGITLSLAEKHFQPVVSALQSKYGEGRLTTEQIRNLNGAPFENRIHQWQMGGMSLLAQRYAGRVDRSTIRYTDDAAATRLREHRARVARDPREDL